MQAAEKKRPREDREFIQRLRPFARLQTAEDFEVFATDMLCMLPYLMELVCTDNIPDEANLRKRIQELQTYRRLGLTTAADIEKYEVDLAKRVWHSYCHCHLFSICDIDTSQIGSFSGLSRLGKASGSIATLFRTRSSSLQFPCFR